MLNLLPAALLVWILALSSGAEPRLPGFEVLTHAEDASVPAGTVHMRYSGPIDYPLAEILSEAWAAHSSGAHELVLEIDSWGGPVVHAAEVVGALRAIRKRTRLVTLVAAGRVCASSCVPVFMQGQVRRAHPASAWMFHAATSLPDRRVSPEATRWVVDSLELAGASPTFLAELSARGYLEGPGEYWVSGYELEFVHQAHVITELLPSWAAHSADELPFDPALGHR